MNFLPLIIVLIIIGLAVLFALRNHYELYHLNTTYYEVASEKIRREDTLKVVMLADLHSRNYGEENSQLLERVAKEKPDMILLAGDIVTSHRVPDYTNDRKLFQNLLKIAPVYYAYGNHEKKMSLPNSPACPKWTAFHHELEEMGVVFLRNKSIDLNESIVLTGLDIDFRYYKKVKREYYKTEQMKKDLAEADRKRFNIVLAHNPRFFKTYAESGRDLFLAGHYHGGAFRIAGKIGVISPQFRFFPRYSKGLYRREATRMIVTGGCGSHKVNLRIQNRPEVVVINIHGNIV